MSKDRPEDKPLEPIQYEGYRIRRIWHEETERWWFAVVDVIGALTGSKDPNKYWHDMKRREKEIELSANCRKFRLKALNNHLYQTDRRDRRDILNYPIHSLAQSRAVQTLVGQSGLCAAVSKR